MILIDITIILIIIMIILIIVIITMMLIDVILIMIIITMICYFYLIMIPPVTGVVLCCKVVYLFILDMSFKLLNLPFNSQQDYQMKNSMISSSRVRGVCKRVFMTWCLRN